MSLSSSLLLPRLNTQNQYKCTKALKNKCPQVLDHKRFQHTEVNTEHFKKQVKHTEVKEVNTEHFKKDHKYLEEKKKPKPQRKVPYRTVLGFLGGAVRANRQIKIRVLGSTGLVFLGKGLESSTPLVHKWLVDSLSSSEPLSHKDFFPSKFFPDSSTQLFRALANRLSFFPPWCKVNLSQPFAFASLYGIVNMLTSLSSHIREILFHQVSNSVKDYTATQSFRHIQSLDYLWHHKHSPTAVTRAIQQGTKASTVLLSCIANDFFPALLSFVMIMSAMTYRFGYQYSLVASSFLSVNMFYTCWAMSKRAEDRTRVSLFESRIARKTIEALTNICIVKVFGAEHQECSSRRTNLLKRWAIQHSMDTQDSRLWFFQEAATDLALAFVNYMSVISVLAGNLSVGDMVCINSMVLQINKPVKSIGLAVRKAISSVYEMQELTDLLQSIPTIKDGPLVLDPSSLKGSVEFKNVTFKYPKQTQLLNNINLYIPAGKKVAFVGPSGSGKTSLLHMLLRLYDPLEGEILLDGTDIRQYTLSTLRSALSFIPQHPTLFALPTWCNVSYGEDQSSPEIIGQAMQEARVPDIYYHTRSNFLSGGEKQRVAIARAFFRKDSRIIVADEPTSAIDSDNRSGIMNELKRASDKTVIISSHQLSSIADCDMIFVIDKNGVSGSGTQEELLQTNPTFFRLWYQQFQSSE